MKEGGGLYHKPSGSTSFCCLLSLPSPLLLPGIQEGVWHPCRGLCASHPQVPSSMGRGSAWRRLPASPSLDPGLAQYFNAEDSVCPCTEGLREYGVYSGLQGFTVLPPLCRSWQLSREVRCCFSSRGVVQGSTAGAAWQALMCQSSTVGRSCTAHAWPLPLRGIIFSSLIPDRNFKNCVSYRA